MTLNYGPHPLNRLTYDPIVPDLVNKTPGLRADLDKSLEKHICIIHDLVGEDENRLAYLLSPHIRYLTAVSKADADNVFREEKYENYEKLMDSQKKLMKEFIEFQKLQDTVDAETSRALEQNVNMSLSEGLNKLRADSSITSKRAEAAKQRASLLEKLPKFYQNWQKYHANAVKPGSPVNEFGVLPSGSNVSTHPQTDIDSTKSDSEKAFSQFSTFVLFQRAISSKFLKLRQELRANFDDEDKDKDNTERYHSDLCLHFEIIVRNSITRKRITAGEGRVTKMIRSWTTGDDSQSIYLQKMGTDYERIFAQQIQLNEFLREVFQNQMKITDREEELYSKIITKQKQFVKDYELEKQDWVVWQEDWVQYYTMAENVYAQEKEILILPFRVDNRISQERYVQEWKNHGLKTIKPLQSRLQGLVL
ncbi:hypothetical protein EJ05DRAFT_518709 [Pseudovirgaria hyperparasitica]|uniref:Uncharacterized protein n=1 Tax=Pseudovirgaria hyperparasitica TaxID=470096 RepID=A0A6A6VZM4_9PEZI|nr:uncharacterized protein EJ05DRAFT_518709 [Pseudovirgaria hyperparasitica]KAF2756102.1 hypothetical protein EJ05DRAFT_518709 [Pseudovirgaria hyperparasitica]